MSQDTTVLTIFSRCANAILEGKLISRESQKDKEFTFKIGYYTEINLKP